MIVLSRKTNGKETINGRILGHKVEEVGGRKRLAISPVWPF